MPVSPGSHTTKQVSLMLGRGERQSSVFVQLPEMAGSAAIWRRMSCSLRAGIPTTLAATRPNSLRTGQFASRRLDNSAVASLLQMAAIART